MMPGSVSTNRRRGNGFLPRASLAGRGILSIASSWLTPGFDAGDWRLQMSFRRSKCQGPTSSRARRCAVRRPDYFVQRRQAVRQTSGRVAVLARQAGGRGTRRIRLPLLRHRFVRRVRQHRQHFFEVLGGLVAAAGALRGLRQSGEHLAFEMDRHLLDARALLLPQHRVVLVRLLPGGRPVLLGQPVREDDERTAGDCRDAAIAGVRD